MSEQTWLPGSTAPKDGTWIWTLRNRLPFCEAWIDGFWRENDEENSMERDPDYWLPIPPLPEDSND